VVYVKIADEELARLIVAAIRECGECLPGEVRRRVEERLGGTVDPRQFRRVLANLVKAGVVRKEARPELMRFVFRV